MTGYLTTKEAAAVLGVDDRTVYYYARDNADFPKPERFGRALMWREEAIREWRKQHPARGKATQQP